MEKVGFIAGLLVASLLISLLMAYPAMILWNACLVPAVSGVKEIGFIDAFGLMILSRIFIDGVKLESKS